VRYTSRINGTRCRLESGFGRGVRLLRLTYRAADGPAPPSLTQMRHSVEGKDLPHCEYYRRPAFVALKRRELLAQQFEYVFQRCAILPFKAPEPHLDRLSAVDSGANAQVNFKEFASAARELARWRRTRAVSAHGQSRPAAIPLYLRIMRA